ncbi:hypothetical protein [Shimazuella kribbensis]|uniref:hypothetical protein n=1 Tax=Shimazuella kribbensis TaxID=139808 RepID=UPI000409200C|nr:hypothetical protein [Shimazuella kribbensis]
MSRRSKRRLKRLRKKHVPTDTTQETTLQKELPQKKNVQEEKNQEKNSECMLPFISFFVWVYSLGLSTRLPFNIIMEPDDWYIGESNWSLLFSFLLSVCLCFSVYNLFRKQFDISKLFIYTFLFFLVCLTLSWINPDKISAKTIIIDGDHYTWQDVSHVVLDWEITQSRSSKAEHIYYYLVFSNGTEVNVMMYFDELSRLEKLDKQIRKMKLPVFIHDRPTRNEMKDMDLEIQKRSIVQNIYYRY